MRPPTEIKEECVFRSFREVNIVDFKDDLRKTIFSQAVDKNDDNLLSAYNIDILTGHMRRRIRMPKSEE